MKIEIRKADISELDLLMDWRIRVLREVFSIPESETTAELEKANREYYREMLSSGGHIACFAVSDEKTVGCGGVCVYREMPSPDNPTGMCAYLMNIFTLPEYRGRGIGEKVVRWLIDRVKEFGITKIYLETSDSARKMYEKIGFLPMADYLKL